MAEIKIDLNNIIDCVNDYYDASFRDFDDAYYSILDELDTIKKKYDCDKMHKIELKKYKGWMKELNRGKKKR